MAFIETVPVEKAEGPLKRQYELSLKRDRRVANVIQALSQNPQALDDMVRFFKSTFGMP